MINIAQTVPGDLFRFGPGTPIRMRLSGIRSADPTRPIVSADFETGDVQYSRANAQVYTAARHTWI